MQAKSFQRRSSPNGCMTRTSSATAMSLRCSWDGCARSSIPKIRASRSRHCAAGATVWRCRAQCPSRRTDGMRSLSARLLLSLLVLLLLFFGVTIAALDSVFRDLSERSLRELLDAQVLTLISASDVDANGGITPPAALLDTRYSNPGSGLYAEIRDAAGTVLWRSPSTVGTGVSFGPVVAQGERRYEAVTIPGKDDLVALSAGF